MKNNKSFHVMQVSLAALDMGLQNLTPWKENSTRFPAIREELIPAGITEGSVESRNIQKTGLLHQK